MVALGRLALLPVLVAGGLAAGLVSAAAPASADVTGHTSSQDVVLYNHCQHHAIDYDVLVSPGTALWHVEIQVLDPQGLSPQSTVVSSTKGSPLSGSVDAIFCGSEPAGTYTVRATGFYEVVPAVQIPVTLPDTTFQAVPAATRTTLSQTSDGHGGHRLTAHVLMQDAKGFDRTNGVYVRLERRIGRRWEKVRGLTLTTVHGRTSATIHGRAGTRVRAVVPSRNNYSGSTSKAVTL